MEKRKLKNLDEEEDSKWSWVIAFSCCFINCLLYGVARLSGILMVATFDAFDINRASASLPFSVSTSVRNLSGIFVGSLGQSLGLRNTIAIGCTLASLGAGLCFFISDIRWMVICWGGIFGTGFGLATCLLPLAINQHFIKYRGIASGISYSGSYIGSFVFPPLVVILLDEYGLSGTFLVICALFLNGLAVSLLFRKPSKAIGNQQIYTKEILNHSNSDHITEYPYHETGNRFKRIWYRLLNKIKSKNNFFKAKEFESPTALSSVYFITSESHQGQMYDKTNLDSESNCQLVSFKDLSLNQINFPCGSNEVPFISQQRYLSLFPNFLQNKIRKGKCKCRINRARNSFSSSIIRKRYSIDYQFSNFPLENVKLVSYRNRRYSCNTEKVFCKKVTETNSEYTFKNNISVTPKTSLIRKKSLENDYFINVSISKDNISRDLDLIPTSKLDDNLNQHRLSVPRGSYNSFSRCKEEKERANSNQSNSHLSLVPRLSLTSSTKSFLPFNNQQEESPPCDKNSEITQCSKFMNAFKCLFGWFRLYGDPMFVIIAITMSLHTFVVVCMITIIEDFAKDIGVSECQVHYVLMVLSIADLIGSLTLGFITDKRFLSRCNFIILCFLGMAICQISISYTRSFKTLLSLVAINGIFESGIIITFPILIAHFIPPKKQAVAVASSNILSSPTVLLVPLVIGYFRDGNGCYSGAFYSLGMTSLFCSFIWFVSTCTFARHKSRTDIPMTVTKQCR